MLFHDSHDAAFREPLGGVAAGGRLRLRFACDEAEAVTLRLWTGEERRVPMRRASETLFEAELGAPETPMLLWYDFIIHKPDGELRYGVSFDQLGGEGALYAGQPMSYQVTVYDPAYATPEWLRRGVIYQIFPDRFFPGSQPASERQLARIHEAHPEARFHANWNEKPALDPDPLNGDNRALDFFGGTLRGIEEKLPYLQALGVTVLYLNPVVRARTNHRYDTGDYERVDPILGDERAFDSLMRSAERHGIKVLLDGVFSHTGADSRYFNRYGRYSTLGAYQSPLSPYATWYRFDSFPDRYNAWWGIYTLPAVEKDDPGYRSFLLAPGSGVMARWLRRGAKGWRLDVVDELPVPLVRDMRRCVKAEDADAALLGEVWEDASNKIAYGALRSYCLGDTLDSVMNYPLRRAVIDFFTGATDAHGLARLILHQREVYPTPFYYSLMNLLGSHDRARVLNAMAGLDREGSAPMPREQAGEVVLSGETLALAKRRHLEAVRLLCALPGAPSVYYGDELGMQGMADPWNRAPMAWDDGDAVHWRDVSRLLHQRLNTPMLQTGLLDVRVVDADTLLIRRYAENGRDAFGEALRGNDVDTLVTRRL